jgi:hypothetical protein
MGLCATHSCLDHHPKRTSAGVGPLDREVSADEEDGRKIEGWAFAYAVARRSIAQSLGFLREFSGECAYYRYVHGRRRRLGFPEGSIMTQPEYERWRTEAQDHNPEIRCQAPHGTVV